MIILGIDQSYTSSGLVVVDGDKLLYSGVFKTPKDMDIFERAWRIGEHVLEKIEEFGVEAVAIEGLAFGMTGNATRDLAGLQFVIVSKIQFVAGKLVAVISPKSLKVFATANGKATKKEMIAAVPEDVNSIFKGQGYKLTTGLADLSDAYFLAQYIKKQDTN
jgi:Holliday junction resolvasome RuvABC endonuclease subunit